VVVVCVAGHFDLLHPGHIRLLEQARGLGDVLVVAVLSQATNPETPRTITPIAERVEMLAALAGIDYATEVVGEPGVFLRSLAPDVIVEGANANSATPPAPQNSQQFQADSIGCRVVRFPLEPGYSTAAIVERILEPPT
jgi:cytidyltransferase-like protein